MENQVLQEEYARLLNELNEINAKATDYLFGVIDGATLSIYGERRRIVVARIKEIEANPPKLALYRTQLKNE